MDAIRRELEDAIKSRIVNEYGNGSLNSSQYLFDQITRVPDHRVDVRMTVDEFASQLDPRSTFIVILDRHANNYAFVEALWEAMRLPRSYGFSVDVSSIRRILSFDRCDMYVTTSEGELLAVGCHEDEVRDGQRIIWCLP